MEAILQFDSSILLWIQDHVRVGFLTPIMQVITHLGDKGAFWILLTAAIGLLYFSRVIDRRMLFLITLFFYISDLICVVIWCPFQTWMMKNKCCVNCRIFNWDHAMMFSPLVFIPSFFSWSLVLLSLLIVVRWEYVWWKYPQRFWFRTNRILQCQNCTEKMCRIKGPLLVDPAMHEHGIK